MSLLFTLDGLLIGCHVKICATNVMIVIILHPVRYFINASEIDLDHTCLYSCSYPATPQHKLQVQLELTLKNDV